MSKINAAEQLKDFSYQQHTSKVDFKNGDLFAFFISSSLSNRPELFATNKGNQGGDN